MKKIFFIVIAFAVVTTFVYSQTTEDTVKVDPKWKLEGVTGINFSQTSLKNWAGGGENSLAGNAYLNGALLYKSGKWAWDNNLALDYGLARTASTGVRKSTDKIDFASKLGYQAKEKLFYTGLFDFKTQFAEGYNYAVTPSKRISNFMAPGYGTLSLGLDYKPNDNFSLYYSPLAAKFTWVLDDEFSNAGMFGVDPGKRFKGEFGSYLKTVYKLQIMENVDLISKADFFTAYDKSFGNIDVDWDVLLSMKINKYLSSTFNTTLRYDDDVDYIDKNGVSRGPRVQFRQILGIGLAYKF